MKLQIYIDCMFSFVRKYKLLDLNVLDFFFVDSKIIVFIYEKQNLINIVFSLQIYLSYLFEKKIR